MLGITTIGFEAATSYTMSKDASASADLESVLGPIASSFYEGVVADILLFIAKSFKTFIRLVTR